MRHNFGCRINPNYALEKYLVIQEHKKEVVVSNHIIKAKQLLDKLQAGRVVYKSTALEASSQTSAEYTSRTESGAPVLSEQRNNDNNIVSDEKFIAALPKNKKGELDIDNFTPEQTIRYAEIDGGKELALEIAKGESKKIEDTINKLNKQISELNKAVGIDKLKAREKIKPLNAKIEELTEQKRVYDEYDKRLYNEKVADTIRISEELKKKREEEKEQRLKSWEDKNKIQQENKRGVTVQIPVSQTELDKRISDVSAIMDANGDMSVRNNILMNIARGVKFI